MALPLTFSSSLVFPPQVDVDDMVAITLGQTTANFTRHAAPELARYSTASAQLRLCLVIQFDHTCVIRSSFSIIYDGNRKTLDLIAKDPNEFAIWTKGLQLLIEFAQNHSVLELTELSGTHHHACYIGAATCGAVAFCTLSTFLTYRVPRCSIERRSGYQTRSTV